MTIPDLIALLEGAEEGSLALDKGILAVLGFTWRGMDYWDRAGEKMWRGPTNFTSSVDAAIALAEKVLPPFTTISLDIIQAGKFHSAKIDKDSEGEACGDHLTTPAIALCIATLQSLRALQAKTGDRT